MMNVGWKCRCDERRTLREGIRGANHGLPRMQALEDSEGDESRDGENSAGEREVEEKKKENILQPTEDPPSRRHTGQERQAPGTRGWERKGNGAVQRMRLVAASVESWGHHHGKYQADLCVDGPTLGKRS